MGKVRKEVRKVPSKFVKDHGSLDGRYLRVCGDVMKQSVIILIGLLAVPTISNSFGITPAAPLFTNTFTNVITTPNSAYNPNLAQAPGNEPYLYTTNSVTTTNSTQIAGGKVSPFVAPKGWQLISSPVPSSGNSVFPITHTLYYKDAATNIYCVSVTSDEAGFAYEVLMIRQGH